MAELGLLALQGDFRTHAEALAARGHATREVRRAEDLEGVAGLVLPGGESTAMLRLLARDPALEQRLRATLERLPVLATCAGTILLAKEVESPRQPSLGVLDLRVARNGYGRQVHSSVVPLKGHDGFPSCDGVFIRAPRILSVGPEIEVLLRRGEDPALVRRGRILAAVFHPEYDAGHPVFDLFDSLLA